MSQENEQQPTNTDNNDSAECSGKKRERSSARNSSSAVTKESSKAATQSDPKSVIEIAKGHFTNVLQNSTPSSSPPSKVALRMKDLMDADNAASNLTLVHEIAVDNDFKIPEIGNERSPSQEAKLSPRDKVEIALKDAMHRAFWDSLAEDLNSDPIVYKHAFTLLAEIKEILLSLLPTDRVTSIHKRINEGLDLDLFRHQADNDVLNIRALTAFLIDTMASVCAPVRDDDVESLRTIDDIVELFKRIYTVLGAMKRDHANFSILSVRPLVKQQFVEYERRKFTEVLSKLQNQLTATERWLAESYQEMKTETNNKTTMSNGTATTSNTTSTQAPSPLTVLKRAYTRLLNWENSKPFPETVLVDQVRFMQLQDEFKRLILLASVVLTTFTSLGPDLSTHKSYVASLKEDLLVLITPEQISKSALPDLLSSVIEQVWHKTCEYTKKVNSAIDMSLSRKDGLKIQVENLVGLEENQVYKVLAKRAGEYMYQSAEFLSQHKAATSPTLSSPAPPGLQVISSELTALAVRYAKLVNLNQLVYGPFYVPVLQKVLNITPSPNSSPGNSPRDPPQHLIGGNKARKKIDMTAEDTNSTKLHGKTDEK